jgi:hypothetical protein
MSSTSVTFIEEREIETFPDSTVCNAHTADAENLAPFGEEAEEK